MLDGPNLEMRRRERPKSRLQPKLLTCGNQVLEQLVSQLVLVQLDPEQSQ
jgi:hypothetical protein